MTIVICKRWQNYTEDFEGWISKWKNRIVATTMLYKEAVWTHMSKMHTRKEDPGPTKQIVQEYVLVETHKTIY